MEKTSKTDWRKAFLRANATIGQAIKNLDESKMQISLVVSEDGALLGTLTDGDIRRGLLRGMNLESPIDSIVHRNAIVVSTSINPDMAFRIMQANKIRQLPVVDSERRVVGLHLLEAGAESSAQTIPIVIMVGGLGTRLRPQTEKYPKPLLPVAGKPILEHIIERAKAQGFSHFVLAVNYLGHMIEDYFGNGDRWQVRIDYLREDIPLGTAGALSLLRPPPETMFAVSNGDVLTDIRYSEILDFHAYYDATATMAVRRHEWQHPFGVVKTNGVDIVGLNEKPVSRTYVNAGIYVLNPSALDLLAPDEPCDMPALFARLRKQGKRTVAYAMYEQWVDIGRPEDLDRARNDALKNKMG
ncbi:MAG: CBS domain-containing protein [Betaproteobacteria bacterium]|nr:CBS domain-containing protein [Betaproteobacteria bacterium]